MSQNLNNKVEASANRVTKTIDEAMAEMLQRRLDELAEWHAKLHRLEARIVVLEAKMK
jgi:hypothetical protein